MDRDEVLNKLHSKRAVLYALGVKSLAIFGSIARNEARQDSDVDILVEFEGRATFDSYMATKFFLEELLACKIDMVTSQALKPRMRSIIEREAIYVA